MKLPTDPVRLTPEVMRGIRMALGLTTTELAEVLGVGRVALSMWENARAQPTRKVEAKYDIVIAVARELGLVT